MKNMQMPQQVINIGSPDLFNQLVNEFRNNLFVIDIYADWCGPCKSFKPVFEDVQSEYHSRGVIFLKVNIDDHRDIAQQFRVMSVPTTLFIYNKKIIHSQPGALSKGGLRNLINQMLQKVKNR